MSKVYFYYSAMNAGKSTVLLQSSYNYNERGMNTLVFAPAMDTRAGPGKVASRIGLSAEARAFTREENLFSIAEEDHAKRVLSCALVACSGLQALASATHNPQLLAQSRFSRSSLAKGREADAVNRCRAILALAQANSAALAAKYHVTTSDRTALNNAITAFVEVQTKPRQGRATSASATAELVTVHGTGRGVDRATRSVDGEVPFLATGLLRGIPDRALYRGQRSEP